MIGQAHQDEIDQAEIVNGGGIIVNQLQDMAMMHRSQNEKLNIRFCKEQEVNSKRQKEIM